jgi:phosphoglycolate phosphatase-like HAD superfamily hydrolase
MPEDRSTASKPDLFVFFDFSLTLVDQNSNLMPGAKELVEQLHKEGAVLGVLTAARTSTVKMSLEIQKLAPYFSIYLGSDIGYSHDDRILLAAGRVREMGGSPARVFCLDDRPMRAASAKAAGFNFIGIATGETSFEAFREFDRVNPVFRDLTDAKAIIRDIRSKAGAPQKREKSRC